MSALMFVYSSGVYAGNQGVQAKAEALAHYIMAVSYDFNSQPGLALKEYERAAKLNSREPMPHLRLARYYLRAGKLDKSIQHLKIVLSLDPENVKAHYVLAQVYAVQKKYNLAAQEYEAILKNTPADDPDNLEVYIYLAQLYYSQDKYSKAIEQFKRILTLQPQNVAARYFLGTAHLDVGDRTQARECFRKVLAVNPDHDGALNSLAYMHSEDGKDLDEALKMARKAVSLDPSNGAYYDTLGWVLHKRGMNAEALIALHKAESYVQDPIIYEHMGDVYQAAGEFILARKFWRKALDLEPNQPHIKSKIQNLDKMSASHSAR